jgi:DNA-binding NarL/FixJ family response regulator
MSESVVRPRPWEGRSVLLVHRDAAYVERCDRAAWTVGLERIGATGSREDALELVRLHRPALVLAALALIDERADGGRRFLLEARRSEPALKLIVVSDGNDPRAVRASLVAGAVAYVVDDADVADIAWAIQQVFRHTVYLAHSAEEERRAPIDDLVLTPRELQVLSLVSEGYRNKNIARVLGVSQETVKFHLTNVFHKLKVSNRTEATHEAHRLGLFTPVA